MTTTTTTNTAKLHDLSIRYCFACKNYGSSQLSMFKDDIEALTPQLLRLGVSTEALQEIYARHTA